LKTMHLSQEVAMALVFLGRDGQYPHDDLRLNKVMRTPRRRSSTRAGRPPT
jgi:hypothetical protein